MFYTFLSFQSPFFFFLLRRARSPTPTILFRLNPLPVLFLEKDFTRKLVRRCSSLRFSFPQKHRFLVFSFSEISLSNFQLFIVLLHYIRQGGIEFELLVSSRNTCFILCLILEEYRVWYLSFKYLREMYIVVCFDVTVTWKH